MATNRNYKLKTALSIGRKTEQELTEDGLPYEKRQIQEKWQNLEEL